MDSKVENRKSRVFSRRVNLFVKLSNSRVRLVMKGTSQVTGKSIFKQLQWLFSHNRVTLDLDVSCHDNYSHLNGLFSRPRR